MLLHESSIFDIKNDYVLYTYVIYHNKSNHHNEFCDVIYATNVQCWRILRFHLFCIVAGLNRRISVAA